MIDEQVSKLSIGITQFITNIGWTTEWIETSSIIECYFIEDIFSYCLTGKITINDTRGLLDTGGLIGNAEVVIQYGDGPVNNSIGNLGTTLTFKLYKINKITPSKSTKIEGMASINTVEMVIVDPHYYKLINQKYSKAWISNKNVDIIKYILKDMVGWEENYINYTSEGTESQFTMPYWTPLQAINWLLERTNTGENSYGVCCFSTIDEDINSGDYNSIGVIQAQMKIESLYNMLNQTDLLSDPGEGKFYHQSKSVYDYNNIISYESSGLDMFPTRHLRGQHTLGYDYSTKKLIDEKFQYSPSSGDTPDINTFADKIPVLGSFTLLMGTEQMSSELTDTESNINISGESDPEIIKNITYNNWFKSYCVQNTTSIIVRGHESRKCGAMIEIQWPQDSNFDGIASYNENLDGKYLIKSVTHYFSNKNRPFYKQKLSLIRNAYNYNALNEDMLYKTENNRNSNITRIIV